MYKKLVIPLILALVTTMAFSNVAFAANESIAGSVVRNVGTIVQVNGAAGTFKLDTIRGQRFTIHVDSRTIYRGQASGFSSLTTNMYVNVQAKKLSNGTYLGVVVNALRQHKSVKITGQITEVKSTYFTVLGKDAKSYTFDVIGKTTFSGFGVAMLTDLQVGMKVKVTYEDMGNGIYRAENVIVTQLHTVISGKVTAKDIYSSTFTILAGNGLTYTFQVVGKTTYSGYGVTSFSKLKVGMKVKVDYATLEGGTLRAMSVIVRRK